MQLGCKRDPSELIEDGRKNVGVLLRAGWPSLGSRCVNWLTSASFPAHAADGFISKNSSSTGALSTWGITTLFSIRVLTTGSSLPEAEEDRCGCAANPGTERTKDNANSIRHVSIRCCKRHPFLEICILRNSSNWLYLVDLHFFTLKIRK